MYYIILLTYFIVPSFTVYSPDPYVTVQVLGTPNGIKRTEYVKDSSDPKWGETMCFYIDPERDHILGRYQNKSCRSKYH